MLGKGEEVSVISNYEENYFKVHSSEKNKFLGLMCEQCNSVVGILVCGDMNHYKS